MNQIELIEKRKPREKHFLQKDGTIRAEIYDTDIHYLKNGKYEEIDNTLVEKDGIIQNKSNDFKVKFNSENGFLMNMEKNGSYLNIKLENINDAVILDKKESSKFASNVLCKNVLDNIDIDYKILSNKVKETIILHNNKVSFFKFLVETNLELLKDNEEIVAKKQNENIFVINKPFMLDSNGRRNDNVYYNLIKEHGKYELQLILDKDWLEDEDTQYPIYIDPTISNNGQNINFYDTYIYPGDTNDNSRSSSVYLKAGVERINGQNRPNRTLIKFSLPTLGTGSEVVYASLDLTSYPTNTQYPTERVATIHRITEDWNESSANWATMNDKYEERTESMFFGTRSTINGNAIIPSHSYYDGNITNLVKKWYKNLPNYGVMLKSVDESSYVDDDFPMFYSKDNNFGNDNNPKPVFSLVYRNHNGIESYLNYKEQLFTDGKAYVNTYNGNLTTIFDIGHTIGGNLPANLGLVYNTNDVVLNNETFFTKGYKLTLEQTIKEVSIDNIPYLEYLDSDGTIHYFESENNSNTYKDEDGLKLSIEKHDNNTCILSDKNSATMIFEKNNNIYRLSSISDADQNTITITYNNDGSINKIADKYLNEIQITYNQNNTVIVSPDQTVTIYYSNNRISSIETKNGVTIFIYDSNDLISSIIDVTGLKIDYEYYTNSPYKVHTVTQIGLNNTIGQYYSMDYGFDTTSIIDNNGKTTSLIYNSYGNLISSNSLISGEDLDSAYSINQKYGDDSNSKNKIVSSQVPIKYIKNYLKNASFESDNSYFLYNNNELDVTFSTSDYVSGNRCLKIESLMSGKTLEQNVTVPKGKYYTFSGYFKNDDNIKIKLSYTDENSTIVTSETEIKSSTEFERNDVTIYYDENASSDLNIIILLPNLCTVYMDDIQLEEGEVANGFNMIENSNFSEGFSEWQLNAWRYDENPINASDYFSIYNFNNNKNTALKVTAKPTYGVSFTKVIPVKGKQGDLYTCSFWYKNLGIPSCGPVAGSSVSIYFKPIGQEAEYCIDMSDNFNPNEDKWQFFTYSSHAPEDFEAIKLVFLIGREANDFYLTNLSLYKNVTSGEYNYDENGNLVSISDQSNNEITFKYDKHNQLISSTNVLGKNFKYEYDNVKSDRVLSAISSTGISNRVLYDVNGNPITTKVSKKYKKNLTPGLYKIRSKGTDKYIKAEFNNVLLEKNDCSNTIWDLQQIGDYYKIVYKMYPSYSISYRNGQIVLDNDDSNNLFEIVKNTDSLNGTYYIKYNEVLENNATNVRFLTANNDDTLSANIYTDSSYNIEFFIEIAEELFIENNAKYTTDGRFVESVTDSSSNETIYVTDPVTGLNNSATNAMGDTIYYTYNNKGKVIEITQASKVLSFSYNNQNLLSTITLNNRVYNLIYDNFLNLYQTKIGNNIILSTNQYEANNGNLSSVTYGNNQVISYLYDGFDRMKELIKSNNIFKYLYDNNDNLSKIISNNGVTKFHYDIANRLIKYASDMFSISYKYDSNDKLINQINILDGINSTISHIYDEEEKNLSTTIDDVLIEYEYDDLYRLTHVDINNTYSIAYDYLKNGKKTDNLIIGMNNGFNNYRIKYDKNRNKTEIYNDNVMINKYEYDVYNQLVTDYDYELGYKNEYVYDLYGNITSKIIKNISTNQTIENKTFTYGNSNWTDQLTNYDGISFEYDSIGNMTKYGTNITMSWTNGRELTNYNNTANSNNITYKYNHDGVRESKIVNNIETKYYLEGNDIIFEKTGDNTIYYLYDSNALIGMKYNNSIYYYLKNVYGDIIGILDSNYNKIVNYKYDSWGRIISITDSNNMLITDPTNIGIINPFRYRGYYYDKETNLYYLNSRYYSPEICRFISADNYISTDSGILGYNMYIYSNNNPIRFIDSLGNGIARLIAKVAIKTLTAIYKKLTSKTTKKNQKKAQQQIKTVQQKTTDAKKNTSYTSKYNDTLHKNANIVSTVSSVSSTAGLSYFAYQERQHGDWDLKNKPEWKNDLYYDGYIMESQDLGNYHYGYVGRAAGIDIDTLVMAGGVVQLITHRNDLSSLEDWCVSETFCDDPRDTFFIRLGALAYDKEHK